MLVDHFEDQEIMEAIWAVIAKKAPNWTVSTSIS